MGRSENHRRLTFEERLCRRTIKLGPDDCWLWTGSKDPKGYGYLREGTKSIRVHRIAYELHNGSIPNGKCVCHRCDNPSCLNPNHLWLGTHRENMEDMAQKGRAWKPTWFGETNPSSKLNLEKVKEIRARYNNGEPQRSIAKDYGIHQVTVSDIVTYASWNRQELG